MSDLREPLHQPPNPEDLRRVPPANPVCARIRGLLRDFVDGDLSRELGVEVEEHAHRCRVCSVELSRAEHERLMICRAFASLAKGEPTLPPGFSARVVQLLVQDETSAAERDAAAVAPVPEERSRPRDSSPLARLAAGPNTLLAAGLLMILCAGIVFSWSMAGDRAPERSARLVVTSADGAYNFEGRRLKSGDGLKDHQTMRVDAGGGARIEWHDLSSKRQPAATLDVRGGGEVRLQDGAPLLVTGSVGILTYRAVDIPMADGSSVRLGVGEYVIAAEVPTDWINGPGQSPGDPFARALSELRVEVEVVSGQRAEIVRQQTGPDYVSAGTVGVYQGNSAVSFGPGSLASANGGPPDRRRPQEVAANHTTFSGIVVDRFDLPTAGASVGLTFTSQGTPRQLTLVSEADGRFWELTDATCDRSFAIVQVEPSAGRPDLGITPPQAWPVQRLQSNVQLANRLVLNLSAPLVGTVHDEFDIPRHQVRVLPCIVDELFGTVLPLMLGQAETDANGRFEIRRLPSQLSPHQHLAVILLSPQLEPTLVPVPERGSDLGTGWWGPLPMLAKRLQPVQLHELPHNTLVEILEEVPGLPGECAVVRRTAQTNYQGRVSQFLKGSGRLWLRVGAANNPSYHELTRDSYPLPRYCPDDGSSPQPRANLFRAMLDISGTDLQLVQSFRHQRLAAVGSASTENSQALLVVNTFGHPMMEAQVFSLDATGPRGSVEPKFHGFTQQAGMFSLAGVAAGTTLFVLGPDGSSGVIANTAGGVAILDTALASTGRVILGDQLCPTGSAAGDILTLRFEFIGDVPAGMRPVAVRFASAATDWEVGGLRAGAYRTVINETVYEFVVPAGGYYTIE